MGLFSKTDQNELESKSKKEYEKAIELDGDTREIRSYKIKIALRARAHLDKTFIEGAEKIAKHSEACLKAVAAGVDKPEPPIPTSFQKVKSANGEIIAYIPEDYLEQAFKIGSKYQLTEFNANQAIEFMQKIMNNISSDFGLNDTFTVLQFLRDEIANSDNDNHPNDDDDIDKKDRNLPE